MQDEHERRGKWLHLHVSRITCLRCLAERERSQSGNVQADKRMILMTTDAPVMSIDEMRAFLSSSDVLTFKGNLREETYGWIERVLRAYSYFSRPDQRKD